MKYSPSTSPGSTTVFPQNNPPSVPSATGHHACTRYTTVLGSIARREAEFAKIPSNCPSNFTLWHKSVAAANSPLAQSTCIMTTVRPLLIRNQDRESAALHALLGAYHYSS